MTTKNIDELTIDEIKEQMALYQRLYYKRKMETDPTFVERKRELGRQKYERKKEKLVAEGKLKPYNKKYNSDNLMYATPIVQ